MIQRHTSLSKNIIQFCRFLRSKDFTIGAEEEIIALTSLQFINYNDKNNELTKQVRKKPEV